MPDVPMKRRLVILKRRQRKDVAKRNRRIGTHVRRKVGGQYKKFHYTGK